MKKYITSILTFVSISLFFIGTAMFIVAPEFVEFNLAITAVFVLVSLLLTVRERVQIRTFLRSSLFKNIFLNVTNFFLMCCILGLINFLVIKNDYYIDITRNQLHSLSTQSKDALKLLSGNEIKIQVFAKRGSWGRFLNLLQLYRQNSKNVKIKAFDVDKELALVSLYDIKENGTIVIEYKNQTYKTVAKNELAVTNLLLKILNPNKKKIYYSVGHNEMSLDDKNAVGGNFLKEKILSSNYLLESIELQKKIPSDATGILILNPQIEFLPVEIDNLKKYIEKGGALLTTLSPQFNGIMTQNYVHFLSTLGVEFQNVLILDRLAAQQGSQASIPVVNSYNSNHPITKDMTNRTLFPVSGVFEISNTSLFKWSSLAKSTPFPGSWGEVNFEEVKSGKAKYDEQVDFKGPLSIVVAGESNNSRVMAIASANFVANQFQGQSNNFNLFLNSLSWLVKEEALMSLNRPKLEGNLIYVSDIQMTLIFYFAILFFPFVFFGIGIYQYRKKISR